MCRETITAEQVRALLDYNPATGALTWKLTQGTGKAGERAGAIVDNNHRYRCRTISVLKQKHLEHRVIWLWVYGVWPEKEIDHRNRDATDNRLVNLREATIRQNRINSKRRQSKTGYRGVYRNNNKTKPFTVQLRINSKNVYLGVFATVEEAHATAREHYLKTDGPFVDVTQLVPA